MEMMERLLIKIASYIEMGFASDKRIWTLRQDLLVTMSLRIRDIEMRLAHDKVLTLQGHLNCDCRS